MSPTPRAAAAIAVIAAAALLLPVWIVAVAMAAVAAVVAVDLALARREPELERDVPELLSRGVPDRLTAEVDAPGAASLRLRQSGTPDVRVDPNEAEGPALDAEVVATRRGRHEIPALGSRAEGPLGFGARYRSLGEDAETHVYPDMPSARRAVMAVRTGQLREQATRGRGPLGLGTEFESVREYSPDDDIRQVNWLATARLGRPMSNDYRLEQDRDLICVVDSGRLMSAPLEAPPGSPGPAASPRYGADRVVGTRLDAAVDAMTCVAMVADELGDHCGAVAFDSEVRRQIPPRRGGGAHVIRSFFDLEPSTADSDYDLAFRTIRTTKRAFVLVLTDLIEQVAARSLLEAIPVLARRHSVTVAGARDPDLSAALTREPTGGVDALRTSVAVEMLEARQSVAARLRRSGAQVIEAPAAALGWACVRAYLRAKAQARL